MRNLNSIVIFWVVVVIELYGAFFSLTNNWGEKSNLALIDQMLERPTTEIPQSVVAQDNLPATNQCMVKPTVTTGSIVNYLMNQGQDYSFNKRKELASRYGIANYVGEAQQNIHLLALLSQETACSTPQIK